MPSPILLDALYRRYGFDVQPWPGARVYLMKLGPFYNAEIVPLQTDADTSRIAQDLQRTGYSCSVKTYASLEEAETHLFEGFFSYSDTVARLRRQYENFSSTKAHQQGSPYEYIECPHSRGEDHTVFRTGLIDHILSLLREPGARLILIEAAAGFGKTCTSYDLLRALGELERPTNPIFAELSRNRHAKLFRYVLLDEIDRFYPRLNYELVQSEIVSGRLPLIVDGFDELLHKDLLPEADPGNSEDAETMLATIGEVLQGQAKVVLTTRRTSIFSGDEFHDWIESKSEHFSLSRIMIHEPSTDTWLGSRRLKLLEEHRVPVSSISNPVLLAFVRSLSEEAFHQCCIQPDRLVKRYFTTLMEREMERQNLNLSVDDQMAVLKQLARSFMEFDITSERREFVKDLIVQYSAAVLEKARASYPSADRPTVEELGGTLAGHALLDRKGPNGTFIGFVNDFVLGTLVGDVLCEESSTSSAPEVALEVAVKSSQYLDFATTAYRVQERSRRDSLWMALQHVLPVMDTLTQLRIDAALQQRLLRTYANATVAKETFEFIEVSDACRLERVVFLNCVFKEVRFHRWALAEVYFISCKFYGCSLLGEPSDVRPKVSFSNCDDPDGVFTSILRSSESSPEIETPTYRRFVLEQFWPTGRANAMSRLRVRTLLRGFRPDEHSQVMAAVEELRRDELIVLDGESARVTNMGALRAELERGR